MEWTQNNNILYYDLKQIRLLDHMKGKLLLGFTLSTSPRNE